ncbi:alpha-galactosidase [Propioniciclava coleopterorum]|uniref:Alpha-galactosidase n=1 Tax=Propioniciclava coleopterorum TaxID=2714937 RepID=A0A6G7Y758_9ACTN|nr:alpha-galactosidase [Propioniciclava coleopterorum]QIK72623.1 alpha-galactosidase [Propioniciclava coleopterorum]
MTAHHTSVLLRGDDVAVLLDLTAGRLPAILHWGADLGDLSPADAAAVAAAAVPPPGPNLPDTPPRLALLPEAHTGWVGRPGISGSRAGRDWSPRFAVTGLTLDGAPLAADGSDAPTLATGRHLEVEAGDEASGLGLSLTVELAAGGLLRSRAILTNTGTDAYQLDDLTLAYPVPAEADELLDYGGRWGKERVPQRRAFTLGTHLREGRHGRTGADAATVLHAGSPGFGFAGGDVWGVHVGWSGNHTHYAERVLTGERVLGGGELLLPGEVVLEPGASYTSPWLHGSHGRGLDAVARRFHRFMRARPGHPDAARPVTLNVWEAVYFDHALEPLLELADIAASVGVERYVLDDGWFGARRDDTAGLGDWFVSPDVWPQGLHPLVDHVRGLGMQFGLWFEPEMVNLDSDVARAHPEWVMATGGRTPIPSRQQQVLNLGIAECYAHVRDAMSAVIAEYDLDYIKWDHNRDLIDAGTQPSGRPGVHAQTLAAYRLMDDLRAAHPRLEIESCSSGGARVDLGVLARTDRVWVSDCIDPLDRQRMLRGTTQLVPPEMMGSHIASGTSHTTGRSHTLNFRAATAVFGHLGIEWDLRTAGPEDRAELAEWIAFYKRERGLLLRGDLIRIDHPDPAILAGGVVAPDRSRAVFSHALVASPDTALPGRLRLPGLDADRRYRVRPLLAGRPPALRPPAWWGDGEGVVLTGAALAGAGVAAPLMFPENAVLHLVEAVD